VSDVYRGAKNEKVTKKGYDKRIRKYGQGSGVDKDTIERLLHHLVGEDILAEHFEQTPYGATISFLKVRQIPLFHKVLMTCTQTGRQAARVHTPGFSIVLKFRGKPKANQSRKPPASARKEKEKVTGVARISKIIKEKIERLKEILLETREQIVLEEKYQNEAGQAEAIMRSNSVDAIAKQLPKTLDELAAIDGVGDIRAKKYGGRVLRVIADYLAANPDLSNFANNNRNLMMNIDDVPDESEVAEPPQIMLTNNEDDDFEEYVDFDDSASVNSVTAVSPYFKGGPSSSNTNNNQLQNSGNITAYFPPPNNYSAPSFAPNASRPTPAPLKQSLTARRNVITDDDDDDDVILTGESTSPAKVVGVKRKATQAPNTTQNKKAKTASLSRYMYKNN
jgi:hypothetical protein